MPTYRLGNDAPIRVARTTCELKLVVSPASAWELIVASRSTPVMGREDGILPQRGGMTVIRPVSEAVSISLHAPTSQVFPVGTTVRAFLSFHTERGREPVEVAVQSLDVGGLRDAVVLGMTPEAEQYRLEAVGAQAPSSLSEEAEASAYVVRRLHGGVSADRTSQSDLSVVIDDSPSMSHWWDNGSVGALLGTLSGLDHEMGSRQDLDVAFASAPSWGRVRSEGVAGLLGDHTATGPRVDLGAVSWPEHSRRLFISDTVPHPVGDDDVVVLLLCDTSATRQLVTGHEETAVVAVPGGSDGIPDALGDSSRRELEVFVKELLDTMRHLDEREV